MEIPGETLLSIPGYDKQITFGQLTNLIYKVEDHGRHGKYADEIAGHAL